MEDEELAVCRDGDVDLDDVGALIERNLVGLEGVAGDVAPRDAAMGGEENVVLGSGANHGGS